MIDPLGAFLDSERDVDGRRSVVEPHGRLGLSSVEPAKRGCEEVRRVENRGSM